MVRYYIGEFGGPVVHNCFYEYRHNALRERLTFVSFVLFL